MLILYGMIVTFLVWLWFMDLEEWGDIEDIIATFFLIVVIGGGIFWGGLTFGLSWLGNYHEKVAEYNLVALKDSNSSDGSFFLGTGYFQGSAAYRYYYELTPDIIGMNQTRYSDGFVRYIDDGSKPRVIQTKEHFKSSFLNHLFFDVKGYEDTYYVPEGSILNEIRLDLE